MMWLDFVENERKTFLKAELAKVAPKINFEKYRLSGESERAEGYDKCSN